MRVITQGRLINFRMGEGGLNYIQMQGVHQPLIAPNKSRAKLLLSFYNFCIKTSQSLDNLKIGDCIMFTVSNVYFTSGSNNIRGGWGTKILVCLKIELVHYILIDGWFQMQVRWHHQLRNISRIFGRNLIDRLGNY